MTDCIHPSMRAVTVFLMPLKPGQDTLAVLSIACDVCSVRFQFVCGDGAIAFNDQRTEMSIWVTEKGGGK